MSAPAAVAAAFASEWGRVVATLIRITGDFDLAEECAQEAFARALERWERDGVPERPGAWLTTVARNRALDRLRRAGSEQQKLHQIEALMGDPAAPEPADAEWIADDRLRLIFTCCHPALALEAQVALTLRTLVGLTTAEIARAFLVSEATMAKRLVRAKQKILHANIPYRVPPPEHLAERCAGVLAVIYLLFNEGYAASAGSELIRTDLCAEAIRLGEAFGALMTNEPEATALLALMRFQHARRAARVDGQGDLVPLEEQDRERFDRGEIACAARLIERLGPGARGPYALQARIAACHALARKASETDWRGIVRLYDELSALAPSPVVALNRAVAVAMADGPAAGLEVLRELEEAGALGRYYLLSAAKADLLRRLGRHEEAAASYRVALQLATGAPERRYLTRRLGEVSPPAQ